VRRQQAARNAEASTQVAAAGETSSIDAMRAKAEEMRRRVEQKKARKKALQQAAAPADGRPAEPPAPWKLVSHPSTPGEWYYHNEETGETAWEAPGGVQEAQQEQLDSVKEAVVAEDDKEKDVKASSGSTSAAIKEEKEAPVEKAKTVAKVGFAARLFGGKSSEEAEVENLEEEAKPEEPPYVPIDEETLSRESARANHSLEVMKEDSLRRRLVMQARRAVMRGAANTTAGGLTKDDLMKNKNGRIVSKKSHERGKMSYAKHLKGWVASVAAARAALDITGFVAVGGASEVGQKLYKKARELYDGSKASS